ncbi:tetratricopeptide repeat protein [Alphaproteobacteria bacterium]|nr:tetratricopeptide repeat protein [Alphaproteobacteria bacterium]
MKVSVRQVLLKARAHTKKGDIAEAAALYRTILGEFPGNTRARKELAALQTPPPEADRVSSVEDKLNGLTALYNEGRLTEVVQHAKFLVGQHPQEVILFNILGAANAGLRQFDDAIESYHRALRINPDFARTHNNLGSAYQDNGNLTDAVASFRRAVQLDPDYAEAHYNLGNALQESGDLPAMIKSYHAAVQVNPNFAEAHYNHGAALQEIGEFHEAITSYNSAILIEPDFAEAHNNLGNALRETGELTAAVESLKRALEINKNFAEAHNNLGITLRETGDLCAAIESFNCALQVSEHYAEAHSNLGNALRQTGDLAAAIKCYRQALQINPDFAGALYNLGNSLQEYGNLTDAIENYRHLILLKPDLFEAHNDLGYALKSTGDLTLAMESFNSALEINPDYVKARENLAKNFVSLGQYENALQHYDIADSPKSRSEALICLYALERYSEFKERVCENLELDENNIWVAAACAFISNQIGQENPHTFCPEPLKFMSFGNIDQHMDESELFLEKLTQDLTLQPTVWEPTLHTTNHGFHTQGDIFTKKIKTVEILEAVIKAEISSYHTKFKSQDCAMISLWPQNLNLTGWSVRLRRNGYQSTHIHPTGWLSGVVYINLVASNNPDDGGIVFELHGFDYPIINEDYPKILHQPQRGDIVLFPSSLFHHTIPIRGDGERLIVAFDLLPD